jgi:hypothetical protein
MKSKKSLPKYFEVEDVIQMEYRKNKTFFLIKWKNYPE